MTTRLHAPDLTVIVLGHRPAPQGSKRHIGNGRMIEQSKRVTPWREQVVMATRDALTAGHIGSVPVHRPPLDGPLAIEIAFTVRKPATAPKRRVTWPTTRYSGDLDKLLRSTFDALTTARAIADDSRIIDVTARKMFPDEGTDALDQPGAVIRIWVIPTAVAL